MNVPELLQIWQKEWSYTLNEGVISSNFYSLMQLSAGAATERVSIYRQSIFINKLSALKNTFKATLLLLGEQHFELLAKEFLMTHSVVTPGVHEIGKTFSAFLSTKNMPAPYVADLAEYEWCWHLVFHGPDSYSAVKLQQDIAEQGIEVFLRRGKGVQLLTSAYLLPEIWLAIVEERYCPLVTETLSFFALVQQAEQVMVYPITHDLYMLLQRLEEPLSLEKIVELFPNAQELLSQLLAFQLLSLARPNKVK